MQVLLLIAVGLIVVVCMFWLLNRGSDYVCQKKRDELVKTEFSTLIQKIGQPPTVATDHVCGFRVVTRWTAQVPRVVYEGGSSRPGSAENEVEVTPTFTTNLLIPFTHVAVPFPHWGTGVRFIKTRNGEVDFPPPDGGKGG